MKLLPTSPKRYVPRFCYKLNLSLEARTISAQILDVAEDEKLQIYHNPVAWAAAAIRLACDLCGEDRTQKEIAKILGASEPEIRERYRKLEKTVKMNIIL